MLLVRLSFGAGRSASAGLRGAHRACRGNYRVIYEIFETAVQVEVIGVQHRVDAYR